MTLYVDFNRNPGPRQFLQRMGRVLRVYPGKEAADVVTFADMTDSSVMNHLTLLDQSLEKIHKPLREKNKEPKTDTQADEKGNADASSQPDKKPDNIRELSPDEVSHLQAEIVNFWTGAKAPTKTTPEGLAIAIAEHYAETGEMPRSNGTMSERYLYKRLREMFYLKDWVKETQRAEKELAKEKFLRLLDPELRAKVIEYCARWDESQVPLTAPGSPAAVLNAWFAAHNNEVPGTRRTIKEQSPEERKAVASLGKLKRDLKGLMGLDKAVLERIGTVSSSYDRKNGATKSLLEDLKANREDTADLLNAYVREYRKYPPAGKNAFLDMLLEAVAYHRDHPTFMNRLNPETRRVLPEK